MSADHHPRYVVRSITGYRIASGGYGPTTDYWIADTWYCWREVVHFRARGGHHGLHGPAARKLDAARRCAELNAEHDAWLACA